MDPISSSSFSYKRSTPALEPDAESGEKPKVKRQTIGSSPFDDSSVDRTSQIAEGHISPIETKLANSPLLQRSFSGPERDSAGIGTSTPKSPNMCVVPPVSVSSSSLSSASLELSKMWAVHATDYLPTNGSICTRLSNSETILEKTRSDIYPSDLMRSTIHFTIGSVFSKHEGMDVDRKCAILLPVEKLLPQMIAINPFDTIILGNLSLDPEAVIVVPQGTEVPGFPGRIEFYDVEKNSDSSLRQKVDEYLRKMALYRLDLSGGGQCTGLNGTALLDDGRDVNKEEFFSTIRTKQSHIYFGDEDASETTGVTNHLGRADLWLASFFEYKMSWFFSEGDLGFQFLIDRIRYHLEQFNNEIKPHLNIPAQDAFEGYQNEMKLWISFLDLGVEMLQEGHSNFFQVIFSCGFVKHYRIHNALKMNYIANSNLEEDFYPTLDNRPDFFETMLSHYPKEMVDSLKTSKFGKLFINFKYHYYCLHRLLLNILPEERKKLLEDLKSELSKLHITETKSVKESVRILKLNYAPKCLRLNRLQEIEKLLSTTIPCE